MTEASSILLAFKTYGPTGGILAAVIIAAAAFLRWKIGQIAQERQARENERAELIKALNMQSQQTLQIVREELRVQQENVVRFFGVLDRNTSALEKLVSSQSEQSRQIADLSRQVTFLSGQRAAPAPGT